MRENLTKWMMVVGMLGSSLAFGAAPAPTKEMLEKAKPSFGKNCAACHGEKGDASGQMAAVLVPKPRNFLTEPFKKGNKPDEVFKTISTGIPGSTMVAFTQLQEDERWALTYYVLELQKPGSVLGGNKPKGGKSKGK
ncbi:c-type cytochrome [Archangium lansingense]|uniref:Cytochrome c n=1 Tax=Archangium lansingense TaxID=2995310 RepID=A0ABT4A9B7_9BACT|nr:cytochrome c [Archangium lansinium]MCY1078248.1 cytochrome c [Archangium lansinium]